jgi:tetratricopeptide (TPR) repeat protein/energy-coupling factor transporter ATP-binding protein EcfA2
MPEVQFNPFPGLRPFEADEDYLFFGREKLIDDLLRRLRTARFLSVIGTSGSGKSSLIRAGLIPALEGGSMVRAGSSWRVAKFRPGGDPIGNLADSLSQPTVLGTDAEMAGTQKVLTEATLRRGTRGLVNAARQANLPPHDNLLIVVDQFEEVFRFLRSRQQENSRDEAVAFVKLLMEASREESSIYIVLTMRSDFIGDCMDFPGLPEAVNAGQYLVPRMTRDELRTAITGPVAVGGGEIAPRLVLRLLNDVGDDQDQLPVLQHALMRTWEHWQQNGSVGPIDVANYEAVGTMQHCLSNHAEQAFEEAVAQGAQHIAERLFKTLTDTFSDPRGVRRPTSVRQLASTCAASEAEVAKVIEVFRGSGRSFLMPPSAVPLSATTVIDISHESLMRCWTRLMEWAEQEYRSATNYARIAQAAKWFEEGTAGLWRDPELELGLQWKRETQPTEAWARRYDENFQKTMQFLDRSAQERERLRASEERARRRKLREYQWAAGVLAALLIVAGVLFNMARVQKTRAETYLELAQNSVNEMLSSAGREQARVAADVPEMESFRKELLEKARVFYDTFQQREPDNDKIRTEVAQAHFRLGEINRLLENQDAAVDQYQRAIGEFERLAKENPKRNELREALANSYNWLGETQRHRPETRSDAEQSYNRALPLQESLVQQNPRMVPYQRELARTYYNRGIVRYENRQLKESAADFRRAIQLLTPATLGSADPGAPQELARAFNNLGNLLRFQENLTEAAALFQQALAIHQRLTEQYPTSREYKFELATFYNNLALLSADQKDFELSRKRNRLALDLLEDLARPAPSLSMELAKGHNLAAEVSQSLGPAVVEAECLRSEEILEKLANDPNVRRRPEFQSLYRDLGYNYLELAQIELRASSLENAQKALGKCLRLLPELSGPERSSLQKSYQRVQQQVRKRNSIRE